MVRRFSDLLASLMPPISQCNHSQSHLFTHLFKLRVTCWQSEPKSQLKSQTGNCDKVVDFASTEPQVVLGLLPITDEWLYHKRPSDLLPSVNSMNCEEWHHKLPTYRPADRLWSAQRTLFSKQCSRISIARPATCESWVQVKMARGCLGTPSSQLHCVLGGHHFLFFWLTLTWLQI